MSSLARCESDEGADTAGRDQRAPMLSNEELVLILPRPDFPFSAGNRASGAHTAVR